MDETGRSAVDPSAKGEAQEVGVISGCSALTSAAPAGVSI